MSTAERTAADSVDLERLELHDLPPAVVQAIEHIDCRLLEVARQLTVSLKAVQDTRVELATLCDVMREPIC